MFSLIGKKLESNNVIFTITTNSVGKKINHNTKTPFNDLDRRISNRLVRFKCKRNNVSELTFRNFSIEALDTIRKKYKIDTDAKDIFNILSKDCYDPACVILEAIPLENDLKFVVDSFIARVKFTENFKLLVLRNFDQKHVESLRNVKFPKRLNLRIEHSDIEILKKLETIKLSVGKIEFSIYNAEVTKEKSKNNTKSKAVSNLSSEPENKIDVGTDEEKSLSDSNPDLNGENIISNAEKDSNIGFSNNNILKIGSVSPINQLSNTPLSIQPVINITPAIAVSDTSLDSLTIIKTLTSDFIRSSRSSNLPFFKTLELIEFVASAPLAEAEYLRNIKDLKNQIDAINEQLKIKANVQEKARALQDEKTILKQDNEHLKSELAAIVSGDQSGLLKYVLEATQLREKNQQQIREIEDLKIKLSEQESNNKRKHPEEENYTSNKQARGENQQMVHNNNFSQNSPQAPYNYSRPTLHGPQFFINRSLINTQSSNYSSQVQQSPSQISQIAKK